MGIFCKLAASVLLLVGISCGTADAQCCASTTSTTTMGYYSSCGNCVVINSGGCCSNYDSTIQGAVDEQLRAWDYSGVGKLNHEQLVSRQKAFDAFCEWVKSVKNEKYRNAYEYWARNYEQALKARIASLDREEISRALMSSLPTPPSAPQQ